MPRLPSFAALALIGFLPFSAFSQTATPVPDAHAAPIDPGARAALLNVAPGDMIVGDPSAPVTMFEYSSLSCPHCAHFHEEILPVLKKDYIDPGKVKLVVRPFPLNKPALDGAKLVACAGPRRGAQFTEVLFKMQERWAYTLDDEQALQQIAAVGGVGADEFKACLADKTAEDKILKSEQEAKDVLGVASTPTFFVGDQKIEGAKDAKDFAAAFDRALGALDPAEKITMSDLDDLKGRMDALRRRSAQPAAKETAPAGAGGLAFRFATDIVAGVAVGGGIGYALDRWLHTLPLFLLICLCLGIAGSFMTVYRANLRYTAELEKGEKPGDDTLGK